jgi:hypothetical protein
MPEAKINKCIYCLSEKSDEKFNIEHVVPRSLGRYDNGYTLYENQVCEECNSYFSKNFETSIGLDSLEALLNEGIKHIVNKFQDTNNEGYYHIDLIAYGITQGPIISLFQTIILYFPP